MSFLLRFDKMTSIRKKWQKSRRRGTLTAAVQLEYIVKPVSPRNVSAFFTFWNEFFKIMPYVLLLAERFVVFILMASRRRFFNGRNTNQFNGCLISWSIPTIAPIVFDLNRFSLSPRGCSINAGDSVGLDGNLEVVGFVGFCYTGCGIAVAYRNISL